ncbi:MAG TPA: DUF6587 family protein [Pseudoxanthomonas sp.]|nr:DUF6587 family protein [Pseudoxanthomonas sp.]
MIDVPLPLQYLAIAAAVVLSASAVVRSQFPSLLRKVRTGLALVLLRDAPPWRVALAGWIAPRPSRMAGASCNGCNGCAAAPKHAAATE